MSDLRWLCEVAHTWGRNTRGTLSVRSLTIGGDSGVSLSVGTMSDADDVQRCDFRKRGHVTGRNEGISFASGPIRAMSFVVPKSPRDL